jgi:hypothetical protein
MEQPDVEFLTTSTHLTQHVVHSHGRPFDLQPTLPAGFSAVAYERAWQAGQNGLARLEPGTPHIIARVSGHYIQLHQPELVIRAVRQVV